MVQRSRRRQPEATADEPLSLVPIISLVLILIAALLLATGSVALSVVGLTAPPIATTGSAPAASLPVPAADRHPLNLTIVITDQGFYLATSGRVLSANLTDTAVTRGPTVPKRADGDYDFGLLSQKLAVIKDAFPEERRVVISAEPAIGYGVLVQTMDAARRASDRGDLFPDVVLSADVG